MENTTILSRWKNRKKRRERREEREERREKREERRGKRERKKDLCASSGHSLFGLCSEAKELTNFWHDFAAKIYIYIYITY